MVNDDEPDELISPGECARILRRSQVTLYRWRRDGRGPRYVRIKDRDRGDVVYWLSDVLRWLECQPAAVRERAGV